MKIDHEKYFDVGKVNEFLGLKCFEAFTSYSRHLGVLRQLLLIWCWKVKILKKKMKHQDSLDLSSSLGESKELSMQSIKDVMVFVHTVMYSGRKDESYADTRVRL